MMMAMTTKSLRWKMKNTPTVRSRAMFSLRTDCLPEPLLEFRFGQKLVYPRDGLFLYGPAGDVRQISSVRYGVIGTKDGVRRFREWSAILSTVVDIPVPGPRSRAVEPQHVPFPGFAEAFCAEWPSDPSHVIDDVDPIKLGQTLRVDNRYEAIRAAVDLFVERIVSETNRLERPPTLWIVVVPDDVYRFGRPLSFVSKANRIRGSTTITLNQARSFELQPTLFSEDQRQAEVYKYAPHFRRQLKARLLKHRIVTQLMRESTLAPHDFLQTNGTPRRRLEDVATIVWNFCTATYYKAGGKPWQLADVRDGVCYVGLVYKRSDQTNDRRYACCAAQMFLTNGDGMVFRGALGPWFQAETRQFHLNRTAAHSLIRTVIDEYIHAHGRTPTELFIHSKSAFTDDEWSGFIEASPRGTKVVGIQITGSTGLKVFGEGNYPVVRGTVIYVSESSAYLFTSGYVSRLDTYMGPETPNPIWVRIVRGHCAMRTVLSDILGLTKLNFNSCIHNDHFPVTINFADDVGDVLISAPIDSEPKLPFKFYI
jgi:hypothetical protein